MYPPACGVWVYVGVDKPNPPHKPANLPWGFPYLC